MLQDGKATYAILKVPLIVKIPFISENSLFLALIPKLGTRKASEALAM